MFHAIVMEIQSRRLRERERDRLREREREREREDRNIYIFFIFISYQTKTCKIRVRGCKSAQRKSVFKGMENNKQAFLGKEPVKLRLYKCFLLSVGISVSYVC